jgi:hypothetical protein
LPAGRSQLLSRGSRYPRLDRARQLIGRPAINRPGQAAAQHLRKQGVSGSSPVEALHPRAAEPMSNRKPPCFFVAGGAIVGARDPRQRGDRHSLRARGRPGARSAGQLAPGRRAPSLASEPPPRPAGGGSLVVPLLSASAWARPTGCTSDFSERDKPAAATVASEAEPRRRLPDRLPRRPWGRSVGPLSAPAQSCRDGRDARGGRRPRDDAPRRDGGGG